MQLYAFKFKGVENALTFVNDNQSAKDVQSVNVGWKYTYVFLTLSEQRGRVLLKVYAAAVQNET